MASVAAKALKLTAEDLKKFNIIDEIYDGNLIYEISTQEAMDRGYLVKYEWIRHLDNVDYSNIRWNGTSRPPESGNDRTVGGPFIVGTQLCIECRAGMIAREHIVVGQSVA